MLFMTVAGSIFKIVHELQRGKKIDTPIMVICHQENWNSEPALLFFFFFFCCCLLNSPLSLTSGIKQAMSDAFFVPRLFCSLFLTCHKASE